MLHQHCIRFIVELGRTANRAPIELEETLRRPNTAGALDATFGTDEANHHRH